MVAGRYGDGRLLSLVYDKGVTCGPQAVARGELACPVPSEWCNKDGIWELQKYDVDTLQGIHSSELCNIMGTVMLPSLGIGTIQYNCVFSIYTTQHV